MKRWRKTIITSFSALAVAALTLGAGTVLGASGGHAPAAASAKADDSGGSSFAWVTGWGGGPRLGVEIDDVSAEIARQNGLDQPEGALVRAVSDDSPASKAGILKGDVIVQYDGERVRGARELTRLVRETPVGRTVEIELVRDGHRQTVEAEVEERQPGASNFVFHPGGDSESFHVEPPDVNIRIPDVLRLGRAHPRLGVSVEALNPQLADFLGVHGEEGLFVKMVVEDSPAEKAGLKAGDVILEVEGARVSDVGDLIDVLHDNAGKTVSIQIVRDKSERTLSATLEQEKKDEKDWQEMHDQRLHRLEADKALRAAMEAQRETLRQYRDELGARHLAITEAQKSEMEEALRKARTVQRDSLESYRDQLRELERSLRELKMLSPGDASGRVEI